MSRSLHDYPWARIRIKGEWASPHSGTKRLSREDGRVRQAEREDAEGLLCEWFPEAPDWVPVTEEAVGLGAYGRVLTVLHPWRLPDLDQEQERIWRRARSEDDAPDEY